MLQEQNKPFMLTREGLEAHEQELEHLKGSRRVVAERIRNALEFGDISENSEYEEAKREQEELENKIAKVEFILKNAVVITEEDVSTDMITIGSKFIIQDLDSKEQFDYQLVSSPEADPMQNKISNESPIGSALVGLKKGNVAEVTVPDGIIRLKVIKIHK